MFCLTAVIGNHIFAVTFLEDVGVGIIMPAVERIIAQTAVQFIFAAPSVQFVITFTSVQDVGTVATIQDVVAFSAI